MDTDTLVENQIEDGQRLLTQLVRNGFDVTAACWIKTSEDGRWFLYIASRTVDEQGLAAAYRLVYGTLPSIENPWVSVSEIKLISAQSPIARDVLELQGRYRSRVPTRTRRPEMGHMAIEEAYIYPPVEPGFSGFEEIKRRFPSAQVFSIAVPRDAVLRTPFDRSYMGKINALDFEGRAPGTLLFIGPESSSESLSARLVFVYRPEGWNKLFRAETGNWEEVVQKDTGRTLYEPVDFSPLAAMKLAENDF